MLEMKRYSVKDEQSKTRRIAKANLKMQKNVIMPSLEQDEDATKVNNNHFQQPPTSVAQFGTRSSSSQGPSQS